MPTARARQARLARGRAILDGGEFERRMTAVGVTATTALFLWRELQALYHRPLHPAPDDRLESLIAIDRPEIDGLVTRFWAAMRGGDPLPGGAPLGPDPSIAELGRHCDRLAGWSPRGAA